MESEAGVTDRSSDKLNPYQPPTADTADPARAPGFFCIATGIVSIVFSAWSILMLPLFILGQIRGPLNLPDMGFLIHVAIAIGGATCFVALVIHAMADKTLSGVRRLAWCQVMGTGVGLAVYWFFRVYSSARPGS